MAGTAHGAHQIVQLVGRRPLGDQLVGHQDVDGAADAGQGAAVRAAHVGHEDPRADDEEQEGRARGQESTCQDSAPLSDQSEDGGPELRGVRAVVPGVGDSTNRVK